MDAVLLSKLAKEIYKQHYLHLWHTGGAEWYMEQYAYAPDKIEKEIVNPATEYYIVTVHGIAAGYIKLNLFAILPGEEKADKMEVERIYLHTTSMGKGIGKQLMLLALQRATELHKEIIFLKAMDSATDAIGFYTSLGYTIYDSFQLPLPDFELMKKEYRGMVVLKRKVKL